MYRLPRKFIGTLMAAALLVPQVAHASTVDPLLTMSLLASEQSRKAACGAATSAAVAGAAAVAAQNTPGADCVLPIRSAPLPQSQQVSQAPAPVSTVPGPSASIGAPLLIAGLGAIVAGLIFALSQGGSGERNPVSPA